MTVVVHAFPRLARRGLHDRARFAGFRAAHGVKLALMALRLGAFVAWPWIRGYRFAPMHRGAIRGIRNPTGAPPGGAVSAAGHAVWCFTRLGNQAAFFCA